MVRKRSGRPPKYAAVPNETVDDATQLDFMALALLTVLLRHRDGWDITLAEIGTKYGYGRDAMANAMGLLQAARYVVKIRLMSAENNQWSTEVCVYDTPATDGEIQALLDQASQEPGVRVAQVIPPTKTALAHSAKRRSKLQPKGKQRMSPTVAVPRVPEYPDSDTTCGNIEKDQVGPECGDSRQSGSPALFKKTIDEKTKNRPSVLKAVAAVDGWTDGPAVPHQIGRNPGVDLLVAIGAEKPEFLLTGKTLQDQGLTVAGMLLEGWTADQLRQVIAGRPLPDQITTTVGAIVSSRLRQALAGPVPETVGHGAYMAPLSVGVATLPRKTVVPLRNCDRCDHAFRSPEPGLCPGCQKEVNA